MKGIKGIIFDYGATLDTCGKHWAEVLWDAYRQGGVPVSKEAFRDAYIYGERYLALHPVVKETDTFREVLEVKIKLQINYLIENGYLQKEDKTEQYPLAISDVCYTFVLRNLEEVRPVLNSLYASYPLVLVSNFYGNIEAVLKEFDLAHFFRDIIESAVVGVRKPDPAIFSLGVEALGLSAEEVVVVGDSYRKDIMPAKQIGCHTIWLKGRGWEEENADEAADKVIYEFNELKQILYYG